MSQRNDVITSITGNDWREKMAAAELLRVSFADTDGSKLLCHSATGESNLRNVGTLIICLRRTKNCQHISYESQIKQRRACGISLLY